MLKLLWFICFFNGYYSKSTLLLKIITWLHSLLWFKHKSTSPPPFPPPSEQQVFARISFIVHLFTTTRPNFFLLQPEGVIYNMRFIGDSTQLNSHAPGLLWGGGQGGAPFNQYWVHSVLICPLVKALKAALSVELMCSLGITACRYCSHSNCAVAAVMAERDSGWKSNFSSPARGQPLPFPSYDLVGGEVGKKYVFST